jgi:hypothetical protein
MPQHKNAEVFSCKICDFKCSKQSNYDKHLSTRKHQGRKNASLKNAENRPFECKCGKRYKHHQTLNAHIKTCQTTKNSLSESDVIKLLLKENNEFKQLIIEQSSKMLELANKPFNITNNNNCNNKQFNLNVFLNEKCKNAMNMKDFINSLEIVDDDFENIGRLGYVQGISNIFLKGLKDLDETERPLHCSDIKRETLYIKDNDVWNKDENNEKLIEAINGVSHKNVKYIPIWRDANPDALDGTSKKNDQYIQIVNQVMTSIVPDDPNAINKIIRNVATRVCIDKTN